jgi:hypothetical protein
VATRGCQPTTLYGSVEPRRRPPQGRRRSVSQRPSLLPLPGGRGRPASGQSRGSERLHRADTAGGDAREVSICGHDLRHLVLSEAAPFADLRGRQSAEPEARGRLGTMTKSLPGFPGRARPHALRGDERAKAGAYFISVPRRPGHGRTEPPSIAAYRSRRSSALLPRSEPGRFFITGNSLGRT